MSRGGQLQEGSVLTMQQPDYGLHHHHHHQPQQQQPHHHHPQQHHSQDVINLQYLELEEFLLENATVVQQSDSKAFVEQSLSQGQQHQHHPGVEKQYQVSLEHRNGFTNDLLSPQTPITSTVLGPPLPQQPHPQALLSDPNSPPQSNCDSPPQEGQRSPRELVMSTTGTTPVSARKSYPRRVSTSSNSSSLVVTPPHTPQQPSPPLPPPSLASELLLDAREDQVKKRRPVKRSRKESVPDEHKDDKYWRRRAKNNEAAKRSRDLRREKENHIMQRVAFLEKENRLLHQELDSVKMENEELRDRLARYEETGLTPQQL